MRRCLPAQALVKISLALFVALVAMVTTLRAEPRRLGLVIGISSYDHLPRLPKTLGDAEKIGKALEGANPKFDVTYGEDVDLGTLNQVVKNFVAKIQPGDVVVVYFAGHGVQAGNHNYLLPTNFSADGTQLDGKALRADELLSEIEGRKPSLKVLILDACRNNPLGTSGSSGLADMQASSYNGDTYIAFAAAPGKTAKDGIFAKALEPELLRPGQSLGEVFINVRKQVGVESQGSQITISTDVTIQKFYFIPLEMPDPDKALATLQRVAAARPAGDMGQTHAVESLIANKYSLSGTELLQGLTLKAGMLNAGDFSNAHMTGADLNDSSLRQAKLESAELNFVTLTKARMDGANVQDASFAFADVSGAHFDRARASNSRWFGVRGAGADFTNAELQGASFMFADLRGAHFDGANLTDAVFAGSLLDAATFAGATMKNTDFTASTVDSSSLKPDQLKEVCRTPFTKAHPIWDPTTRSGPPNIPLGTEFSIQMVDPIPNSAHSGGIEYRDFLRDSLLFPVSKPESLPVCRARPNSKGHSVALYISLGGLEYMRDEWRTGYPHDLLASGDRESIFRAIVRNHLKTIHDQIDSAKFLQVAVKAELLPSTTVRVVPGSLPLDFEFVLLMLIRDHPDLIPKLDWHALAKDHLIDELRGPSEQPPLKFPWGTFFPERTYPEAISPGLVGAFREWCENRATHLPRTVSFMIQPVRKTDSNGQSLSLFDRFIPFHDTSVESALPAANIPQPNLVSGEVRVDLIREIDAPAPFGRFALVLPQPAASYLWKLSAAQEREANKGWHSATWMPLGELTLAVRSLRLVPKISMLLLEVEPVRFQVREQDQVVFLLDASAQVALPAEQNMPAKQTTGNPDLAKKAEDAAHRKSAQDAYDEHERQVKEDVRRQSEEGTKKLQEEAKLKIQQILAHAKKQRECDERAFKVNNNRNSSAYKEVYDACMQGK